MDFFNDLVTNPGITKAMWPAFIETLQMTGISGFFTVAGWPAAGHPAAQHRQGRADPEPDA